MTKVKEYPLEEAILTPEERWGGIDFSDLISKNNRDSDRVYTPEFKVQICTAYFLCGNMRQVCRDHDIDVGTISSWRNSSHWWDEVTAKLRTEKQAELDAMMTSYLHEAQNQALDRIKNGDYKLDRHGELKRVPMSGRDIALTSVAFFDKRALIRGDVTSITRRKDPLSEIKDKLEQFAKFNSAKEIDGKSRKMTSDGVSEKIRLGQLKYAQDRGLC